MPLSIEDQIAVERIYVDLQSARAAARAAAVQRSFEPTERTTRRRVDDWVFAITLGLIVCILTVFWKFRN